MESEWNKLSDADRAEFSAWREMKRRDAEAKAAEAETAAAPKKYDAMTSDEKRAWRRSVGIPVSHGERL